MKGMISVCRTRILLDKDVYLGDLFGVSKKVNLVLGKVGSIRVTKSGLELINCVSEEKRKKASRESCHPKYRISNSGLRHLLRELSVGCWWKLRRNFL